MRGGKCEPDGIPGVTSTYSWAVNVVQQTVVAFAIKFDGIDRLSIGIAMCLDADSFCEDGGGIAGKDV